MPASEVGIAYQDIPRNQVAAANPARSVVAPPPKPIIASSLARPAEAHLRQTRSNVATLFWFSPSGLAKIIKFLDSLSLNNFIKELGAISKTRLWSWHICFMAAKPSTPT